MFAIFVNDEMGHIFIMEIDAEDGDARSEDSIESGFRCCLDGIESYDEVSDIVHQYIEDGYKESSCYAEADEFA